VAATVLLLHGILDTPALWDGVAPQLEAEGFRVLRPAARGHAGEWRPGLDWSPHAAAEEAVALLRREAREGAHLVGHSRGGTAASWIAVDAPELVKSLSVVASPPQMTEAFRAHFRHLAPRARDAREAEAFAYLASIPEDDFPAMALRRYRGRALVVEAARDPLYAPTQTLFWRAFLPFAEFERVEHGHDVPREAPAWLAARLISFFGGG
jgi:pimeloyl-ACP methyl ester carboxylesterase